MSDSVSARIERAMKEMRMLPCICQDCDLHYAADDRGNPKTIAAFTCDDCGGYVGDIRESEEWKS